MSGTIGFSYCGDSADIRTRPRETWFLPDPPDHDAVYCFGIGIVHGRSYLAGLPIFFPVFPWGSYHVFAWKDDVYRYLPIRTTPNLLLRALVRPLNTMLLLTFALLTGLIALALALGTDTSLEEIIVEFQLNGGTAMILAGSLLLEGLMRWRDRWDRAVRLVIGPHDHGCSDPALWTAETRDAVISGLPSGWLQEPFVDHLLGRGEVALAMYLTRIARGAGEGWARRKTRRILRLPAVRRALRQIGRQTWRRDDFLPPLRLSPEARESGLG